MDIIKYAQGMKLDAAQYHGREGRRTSQGYKMFHIVQIEGRTYEIQASTKEKAIELAWQKHK